MAHPGLLSWANSIRHTMVNHQSRQTFNDQIQSYGFLFLDDYMDSILAQAKRDPLIDLVKTPGRKKDAPKRTRAAAAAAKAKSVVILLEDNDAAKESEIPVNSFQKALLRARNDEVPSQEMVSRDPPDQLAEQPINKPAPQKTVSIAADVDWEEEQTVEDILSSPPPSQSAPLPVERESARLLLPLQIDQANDLSIIAEDDESTERSVPVPCVAPEAHRDFLAPNPRPIPTPEKASYMEIEQDDTNGMDITTSSSGQTFHSIPLDSPELQRTNTRPNSEYATAPLPQLPQSHSGQGHPEAMTAPLPTMAPSVSTPNAVDVPVKDSPPTHYSSLPAPSPLRKSMRVQREPSVGLGMHAAPLPAATNGVGAGKRTSWLMKAREVKAMEAPGKRTSTAVLTVPVPGTSGILKRKSGDMFASTIPGMAGIMALDEEERKRKFTKMNDGDIAVAKETPEAINQGKEKDHEHMVPRQHPTPPSQPLPPQWSGPTSLEDKTTLLPVDVPPEGIMDRFKRTVEGLGARAGMGKSLGGPAAAAVLAEARADKLAANARIAERDERIDTTEVTVALEQTHTITTTTTKEVVRTNLSHPNKERKLSVSDLVTAFEDSSKGKAKEETKEVGKSFKPVRSSTLAKDIANESTSTTPPNSPPGTQNSSFVLPSGPVFNKPPVFVPPAPAVQPREVIAKAPSTAFSLPAVSSLGVPARLPSPPSYRPAPAISTQSTVASLFSDRVFDSQQDVPTWVPDTQDTEYSAGFESPAEDNQKIDDMDEDDSWPMVDEKLAAANPAWTPFGFAKEDSMTWSTLPTESQRDIRSTQNGTNHSGSLGKAATHVPTTFDVEVDDFQNDAMLGDDHLRESDLEDIIEPGKSTASLVKPSSIERSHSQMSMASTSSSQSQTGWMGQATKLVSSVLGGSKNKKPQVPSLQRAAAAAKKEKEEKDKKATRLKEMESRRQLAVQRKADEEKSKALEDERKMKEEGEKRKRERDETTDKRPLKTAPKKEEDATKKRKITVEIDKKPTESKKPPSKDKKDNVAPSRMPQPTAAPSVTKTVAPTKSSAGFKPSTSSQVLAPSTTHNAQIPSGSTSVKPTELKTVKPPAAPPVSSMKGKGKAKMPEEDLAQPSHQLQSQMAARAKLQLQAANQLPESTEDIELPDINSEYSDSEDEDRPRTFDPPNWAQSPELRLQLERQSRVNPDEIFGPIRPLRMEEVFRTRQSRFRARTSSANWTGTDRLTTEEEVEYVRRMGFR